MLPVSRGDHQGQDDQRDDPDPLRRRQLGEGEEESGDTGQGRGHQKDSGPPVDPHSCDEPTYHDQSSGNGYDTDDGMNQGKRDDVHGVLLEWNVLQEIHGRRSPGWPGRSAPRKRRRWSYVVSGLIVLLVSLKRTAAELAFNAARRSWALRHRHDGSAEGEDPWLCDPGFRRVCFHRSIRRLTVGRGSTPVKICELLPFLPCARLILCMPRRLQLLWIPLLVSLMAGPRATRAPENLGSSELLGAGESIGSAAWPSLPTVRSVLPVQPGSPPYRHVGPSWAGLPSDGPAAALEAWGIAAATSAGIGALARTARHFPLFPTGPPAHS